MREAWNDRDILYFDISRVRSLVRRGRSVAHSLTCVNVCEHASKAKQGLHVARVKYSISCRYEGTRAGH